MLLCTLAVDPGPDVSGEFADREQAQAWLDAERADLTAAVRSAGDAGKHGIVVELAASLATYLEQRRELDDWIPIAQLA